MQEDKSKLRVAIITGVMPSYSDGFYRKLFAREDLQVKVFCQESIPGTNLKTIHSNYPDHVHLLRYISCDRDILSWQFIPWTHIVNNYDIFFVAGNPRNLSHALIATFLKLLGKKIVLWTMAHSYRSNSITENIRLFWSRFFDYLLVYTDNEVDYLRRKGFSSNYIVGQNNGLDQKSIDEIISLWPDSRLHEWQVSNRARNHTVILSCARLVEKNRFDLIVQALPKIVNYVPDLLWCVIGAGSERDKLESMVDFAGLSDNVRFVGELYNEEELAPWFLSSKIFVHPNAIGLGLLHAFGYGLPVVVHDDSNHHGPEYAAFEKDITGRTFSMNDVAQLAETVLGLLRDDNERSNMGRNAQKIVRDKFNVDVMVERFISIAKYVSSVKA